MTNKSKRLGRGLGALIPKEEETSDKQEKSIQKVKVDLIKPNHTQPRKSFDQDKIQELMESIDQYGLIQPIVVRELSEGFEIIAGERRWRAAKNLKMDEIPAIIREVDDVTMSKLAIIENIQREDLNDIEEAKAYAALIENYELTQKELSKVIGKSRTYITNKLRLLNLDDEIIQELIEGNISNGHARALLAVEKRETRLKLMQQVIDQGLSVRKIEKMIKNLQKEPTKQNKTTTKSRKPKEIIFYEDNLRDKFNTKVNIKHKKDKGKIEIEYYSIEDLNRILELL